VSKVVRPGVDRSGGSESIRRSPACSWVAIGKGGRGISDDEALDHFFGYAVGPVEPDRLVGHIDGVGDVTVTYDRNRLA
jgi:hypothetical protein